MSKASSSEIKRGQSISFRVPSDTPDHILKHLQKLKETEKRNFSSKMAEFVMQGVSSSQSKDRETITIPLPKGLSKVQRDWLKHEHSEALLGSIIYQLITDPVRATSLLASLNSRSSDIDEVLYLQEEPRPAVNEYDSAAAALEEDQVAEDDLTDIEDDLLDFDWDKAKQEQQEETEEESEEDLDTLLGGFLAHMNK
jgi:ribosomal protein L12E/L44/L45/RPP1/RPP2